MTVPPTGMLVIVMTIICLIAAECNGDPTHGKNYQRSLCNTFGGCGGEARSMHSNSVDFTFQNKGQARQKGPAPYMMSYPVGASRQAGGGYNHRN